MHNHCCFNFFSRDSTSKIKSVCHCSSLVTFNHLCLPIFIYVLIQVLILSKWISDRNSLVLNKNHLPGVRLILICLVSFIKTNVLINFASQVGMITSIFNQDKLPPIMLPSHQKSEINFVLIGMFSVKVTTIELIRRNLC